MKKMNKIFNLKFVLIALASVLILGHSVYGIDLNTKAHLRIPLTFNHDNPRDEPKVIPELSNEGYNALSILKIPEMYEWLLKTMIYKYTEFGISEDVIKGTLKILGDNCENPEIARLEVLEKYNYLDPDSTWAKDRYSERVAKIGRHVRGQRIVDAGCGDNGFGKAFLEAKHYPDNMRIIGIDIFTDDHVFRKEIFEHPPYLRYICQKDDFKLPVESSWATTVNRFSVYHHTDYQSQERMLQEDYRILEEGGRLIVFEDVFDYKYGRDTPSEGEILAKQVSRELKQYIIPIIRFNEWMIVRILFDREYLQIIYPRTKEGWIEFFTNGGFEVEEVYTEFPKSGKSLVPSGKFILRKISRKEELEHRNRHHL